MNIDVSMSIEKGGFAGITVLKAPQKLLLFPDSFYFLSYLIT
jgi:hypothetical protein